MNAKENMDMLVDYERIDRPTDAKQRLCWAQYIADKIVKYCGTRELCLGMLNADVERIDDNEEAMIRGLVVSKLLR